MWDIYQPLKSLRAPLGVRDRADFLCELAVGRRVLHVGCAAAPVTPELLTSPNFLHRRLVEAAQSCCGVDTDAGASQMLRDAGFLDIITADATELSSVTDKTYDLIVLGEVLEHVNNPGLLLDEMAKVLDPGGRIVVTVPNAYNLLRFLQIFAGREVVHMDHVAYYSPKTLSAACARVGLALETVAFTDPFRESPGARSHRLLSAIYRQLLTARPFVGQSVIGVFRFIEPGERLPYHVLS
jgi:SAM-dependent methyltransferase